MTEHPKVFIAYSHDSPEHKRWVSELGVKLRHNGVDAILDQWDLGPGDDITQFMEHGIIDSDRVLVVCTDRYVRKANAAEGGVGYERMIVTAQLVQDLGTNKFIPVIRQASEKEETPTFLGARVYIDFRNDNQFNERFDELLRELHREPVVERPPLGKNHHFLNKKYCLLKEPMFNCLRFQSKLNLHRTLIQQRLSSSVKEMSLAGDNLSNKLSQVHSTLWYDDKREWLENHQKIKSGL